MSWHGVRKAVDRAGTQLLQKTGMVEKTVDKEFDDEERRFRNMERKAERLYREGKAYLDAVRGTCTVVVVWSIATSLLNGRIMEGKFGWNF